MPAITKELPIKNGRGAQLRGRSPPVFPVRLRRWRARLVLRGVFVAAQKFVSFNLGYHSDAAGFIDFGALDASETPHLDGAGEGNFMRQRQQNLHWRTTGNFFWKEEVHPSRTNVSRFG